MRSTLVGASARQPALGRVAKLLPAGGAGRGRPARAAGASPVGVHLAPSTGGAVRRQDPRSVISRCALRIDICPCSSTPAKSAITSSKRWCAAASRRSARPAMARNSSGVCRCLPPTPTARARCPMRRWARADRAAIRADRVPARLTENGDPGSAGYLQLAPVERSDVRLIRSSPGSV